MGIHGLWQVLEPTGRPVNIHSLRGKVLAVDVSIWLHQLVKGFRDKDGNPLPNAHLLGVLHRICKLLSYGVKPIFVFDGSAPALKRATLAARRQRKLESLDKAELSRQKILSAYLQRQLLRHSKQALPPSLRIQSKINSLSQNKKSPSGSPVKSKKAHLGSGSRDNADTDEIDEDLQAFRDALVAKLEDDVDPVDQEHGHSDFESDEADDQPESYSYGVDYSENFSVIQAPHFDTLPLETQHEILFEMQESRKMNSWGKYDKMPKDLQSFSSFQMDRLVKRRTLQKKIQSVQKEMGQRHIHVQNLDELLKMDYNFEDKVTKVGGTKNDGFVLIKSQDKAINKKDEPKPGPSTNIKPEVITIDDFIEDNSSDEEIITKAAIDAKPEVFRPTQQTRDDEEEDIKLAIQLSLMESNKVKSEADTTETSINDNGALVNKLHEHSKRAITVSTTNISQSAYDSLSQNETNKDKQIPLIPMSIQSTQMSHCAKFLDTVGFHIPSTSALHPNKEETKGKHESNLVLPSASLQIEQLAADAFKKSESESESDDEFEDVDETVQPENSVGLPGQHDTAPTISINLDLIQKSAMNHDLFADVFTIREENEDETCTKLSSTHVECEPLNTNEDIPFEDIDFNDFSSNPTFPNKNQVRIPAVNYEYGSDDEIEADLTKLVVESTANQNARVEVSPSKSNTHKPSDESQLLSPSTSTKSSDTGPQPSLLDDRTKPVSKIITAEYMQEQERLNSELGKLQSERGFQERVATSISDQMQVETQELVSLFGIPYIVSPTEAESQCAFLDQACLTEGTITDDSDVWLFGGQRVYKNFFSQGQRHTELYQAADIQRVLNLNREKLIVLAILIGSDYSDGIQGVGPVLALEILSEFCSKEKDSFDALVQFREWWDDIQTKTQDVGSGSKLKEKLRKLKLRPGFPSKAVYEAFIDPAIDTSTESFKWGNPDLDAIRTYTKQKFGWDQSKCDSILMPVLKKRCEAEQSRQLTLDSYTTFGKMSSLESGKRKNSSKRIQTAVKKLKRVGAESHELNLSAESSSEDETERIAKKVVHQQVHIKKLKAVKRTGAQKSIKSDKLPESPMACTAQHKPSTSTTINPQPKPQVIPQRVQEETDRMLNKKRAIEIFKQKGNKKKE